MHTVREFIEKSFGHVGIQVVWEGEGVKEVGKNKATGEIVVRMDERYYRPAEVEQLLGNPAKAKKQLGWEPTVKFAELVKIMTDGDLKILDGAPYSKGF
jgi:GDPmannose 4,6-dehydratase